MKSIAVSIVAVVVSVFAPIVTAQPHHGMRHFDHHHHHYSAPRGDWNWVAPAIIGGALLYGLTRPDPVIVQQPMYVPQPGFVVQPGVTYINGSAYIRQIIMINGVAQEVLVRQ
jgi:hypothetical protein